MESLQIEETTYGPQVSLSTDGKIEIAGKSMMEDAEFFYSEIYNWVEEYITTKAGDLSIEFNLKYFNSSSAKQLLKMLMKIDDAPNLNATVTWLYPSNNDILLERGEELAIMLDLPFNYKAV